MTEIIADNHSITYSRAINNNKPALVTAWKNDKKIATIQWTVGTEQSIFKQPFICSSYIILLNRVWFELRIHLQLCRPGKITFIFWNTKINCFLRYASRYVSSSEEESSDEEECSQNYKPVEMNNFSNAPVNEPPRIIHRADSTEEEITEEASEDEASDAVESDGESVKASENGDEICLDDLGKDNYIE